MVPLKYWAAMAGVISAAESWFTSSPDCCVNSIRIRTSIKRKHTCLGRKAELYWEYKTGEAGDHAAAKDHIPRYRTAIAVSPTKAGRPAAVGSGAVGGQTDRAHWPYADPHRAGTGVSVPSGNGYPYSSGSPVRAGRLPPTGDSAKPGTDHGRSGGSLPLMCPAVPPAVREDPLGGEPAGPQSRPAFRAAGGRPGNGCGNCPAGPAGSRASAGAIPPVPRSRGAAYCHGGSSDDPESGRPGPPVPGRGRGAVCWCAVHAPHIFSNWTPSGGMPDSVPSPYTRREPSPLPGGVGLGAVLGRCLDCRVGTSLDGSRVRQAVGYV